MSALYVRCCSDRDTLDIGPLKKQLYLQVAPSQATLCDQSGQEMHYELDASIQNFLSCSEVWTALPLQSRLTTYDIKSDIQALAESWANPAGTLDTSWSRPSSFIFLSVFAEDENGIELARRVSTEHHLAFLQLGPLLDECVKMSYDPQKLGDQVTSLSDCEVCKTIKCVQLSSVVVSSLTIDDDVDGSGNLVLSVQRSLVSDRRIWPFPTLWQWR